MEKPYGGKSPITPPERTVPTCDLPKIDTTVPQEHLPKIKTEAERREELEQQEIQNSPQKLKEEALKQGCNTSKQRGLPSFEEISEQKIQTARPEQQPEKEAEKTIVSKENENLPKNVEDELTEENITQEKVEKLLKNNKQLQEAQKIINELKVITSNKHIDLVENTINKNIVKWEKLIKETEESYELLRKNNDDIIKIADNTKLSLEFLKRIKDHLFNQEHKLRMGINKFNADPDILASWNRLMEGNFVQSDLKLLLHEYAESLIMKGTLISYDKVHPLINQFYNWENTFKQGL